MARADLHGVARGTYNEVVRRGAPKFLS
jgi:hypothetical protein